MEDTAVRISAVMVSCPARIKVREQTLASLSHSDWRGELHVIEDDQSSLEVHQRIRNTWRRAVERGVADDSDFVLLLEDDLIFNRHLWQNLRHWEPIAGREKRHGLFGSLYNPGFPMLYRCPAKHYCVADANRIWGAQAYLVSHATARWILDQWGAVPGAPDQMMPRLAATTSLIYYHVPSLVQHRSVTSTWGGRIHAARNFELEFRSEGASHA